MNFSDITKGAIVMVGGWWFVVVKNTGKELFCICDNANNIYAHEEEDIEYAASAYDAIRYANWGSGDDDELYALVRERAVPIEVIAEVLAGCHDDRFDHWDKE